MKDFDAALAAALEPLVKVTPSAHQLLTQELRDTVKLRTKPTPLVDFINLCQRAADELDRLKEFEWMYLELNK